MSRYRTLLAATAFAALIAPALLPSPAHAEEACNVSGPVMSKAAMEKSLMDRGYIKIRSLSVHNGCYEAKGFDRNGHRFELELNGQTGAIHNQE